MSVPSSPGSRAHHPPRPRSLVRLRRLPHLPPLPPHPHASVYSVLALIHAVVSYLAADLTVIPELISLC